jgi:molybdenum cofactor cytidylyltransferase
MSNVTPISAIVLAAGLSRRMGRPKLALRWGETTVLGHVVGTLNAAGLEEIVVVTGGGRAIVQQAMQGLPAREVFNPNFEEDHMLFSLQAGLKELSADCAAALVALGDQPQMRLDVVQALLQAYVQTGAGLVIPSFQMRRGHPWIVARSFWNTIFALQPPATLRDFLSIHANQIAYLPVETDTILRDLDTPEDYAREQPE